MKSFLKILTFLLIILVGVIGIAVYWTFYKPLPNYSAKIDVPGLNKPVSIKWDQYGVPHITADNKHDLYFAVGYVHAQDRLWQMTLIQLAEEGRFAEFFGKKMVPYDKFERTLGFWRMAKKLKAAMPDSEISVLQDYADGVNAYVRDNSNKLPIEFSLTGMKPIPWTVENSIAFERMLGWQLNVCWWSKATYNYLAGKLDSTQMAQIYPTYPDTAPTSLNRKETHLISASLMPMVKQDFELRHLLNMDGTHVGSNAWVVDGSRTKSGFPMLAGDPHLGLKIPGDWYEVVLNLNGRHVSGATHPGTPFVILGQNNFLAWSLTNIMADDTDFFVEQTDPNDRGRYVADSLKTPKDSVIYKPFRIKRELIKVKDGNDVIMQTRFTDHGPVISDIYPDKKILGNKVIAMDWTGYDISDETGTFMKIDWAQSFEQFQAALKTFGVPGQNFMYADRTGNIAMFSVAKIPIRNYNPILFRKGWDPSYNWKGFIPFKKLPHVINPKSGWIANANNKLVTNNYPYYISSFWEPPSRIENITAHLEDTSKVTVQDFMALQNSSYSVHARQDTKEILPILETDSTDTQIAKAITYLKNWDYKYNPSETAASIFDAFYLRFSRNTLQDEMGKDVYNDFTRLENLPVRVMDRLLNTPQSSLFDNIHTEKVETKKDIVIESMKQAVQFLTDSLGTESYKWQWENLHAITFNPPLLAEAAAAPKASDALKLIVKNILSRGPYPVKGDGLTVNNGQYSWRNPYNMILGPSIRRIVDFSNLNYTYSVLPTGESGNPLSKHYDDQINLWLKGNYRKLSQDTTLTQSEPHKTMILRPTN